MVLERATCHDCHALEGQLHERGCDMERCPICGGQLISCDCRYDWLDLRDPSKYSMDTCHLPPEIYNNDLSDEQFAQWEKILQEHGRIPWIQYPNICCKCGTLWPEMFMVPDEEWERYVAPSQRRKMLCRECYQQIKDWIDAGVQK